MEGCFVYRFLTRISGLFTVVVEFSVSPVIRVLVYTAASFQLSNFYLRTVHSYSSFIGALLTFIRLVLLCSYAVITLQLLQFLYSYIIIQLLHNSNYMYTATYVSGPLVVVSVIYNKYEFLDFVLLQGM